MASAFGHALAAYTIGNTFSRKFSGWKFFLLGIACSILPDADVISFAFGIPYEAFWGHRGFTHSLVFALLTGLLLTFLFYRRSLSDGSWLAYITYFTLCTASHSVLDALTNGGLGVAFFLPWDATRYFFPWRPIKVSPIGVENFFSEWGASVLLSEWLWIGMPCLIILFITNILRKKKSGQKVY